jgi:hypothetical protein
MGYKIFLPPTEVYGAVLGLESVLAHNSGPFIEDNERSGAVSSSLRPESMHDSEFLERVIPEVLLVKIENFHRFVKQIPSETTNLRSANIPEGKRCGHFIYEAEFSNDKREILERTLAFENEYGRTDLFKVFDIFEAFQS